MSIDLSVVESKIIHKGQCVYHSNDFSLEYIFLTSKKMDKIQFSTDKEILLIFDTLTIVFDSISKEFKSFDSYTNKENWIAVNEIETPNISKKGNLKLTESEEILEKYSFKTEPIYEYSRTGILRIILSQDGHSDYSLIGENLIVGINKKKITCFICTHLAITS